MQNGHCGRISQINQQKSTSIFNYDAAVSITRLNFASQPNQTLNICLSTHMRMFPDQLCVNQMHSSCAPPMGDASITDMPAGTKLAGVHHGMEYVIARERLARARSHLQSVVVLRDYARL